ncbi:S-adenosyl-L-methionine-dependent methyltransferase [Russula compacta]|nr:S-adenosyl-L-methionine-dependent methyltransferase [Russula compacta]
MERLTRRRSRANLHCRLDTIHHGIKNYLDGKIFLAPLDNPQTILDIGCVFSHLAIESAEKFPDAQVIAVDINPLLSRFSSAPNFQFQQLDILAEPLPLEAGSFDVVHVRFLLIHLPNPQRVLERIAQLVKPGGWLLIEEMAISKVTDESVPALRTAVELFHKYGESNGQVPGVYAKLEPWLRQTGAFSEVNVHEVIIPIGNPEASTDPKRRSLGLTFKGTFRHSFTSKTHPELLALGYTPELKEQVMQEFNTLEWQMGNPLHFVWARRSV